MGLIVSPKMKTTEGKGIKVHSFARNILRVDGHVEALKWD
jgi:prepilin-type processing-associated H-X9-DG protein